MYGFYDPENKRGALNGAYNDNFMKEWAGERKNRVDAFNKFRTTHDPNGMFLNDHVEKLLDTYWQSHKQYAQK